MSFSRWKRSLSGLEPGLGPHGGSSSRHLDCWRELMPTRPNGPRHTCLIVRQPTSALLPKAGAWFMAVEAIR